MQNDPSSPAVFRLPRAQQLPDSVASENPYVARVRANSLVAYKKVNGLL